MGFDVRKRVLIFCLIILLIFQHSTITQGRNQSRDDNSDEELIVPLSGSDDINLKYYLRKFWYSNYFSNSHNLSLRILVESQEELSKVLMQCWHNESYSENMTMVEDVSNDGWYHTLLVFEIDDDSSSVSYGHSTESYSVRYIAITTEDIVVTTEICVYEVEFTSLTSDGGVTLYDTPDLWYIENSTGHTIMWDVEDGNPSEYQLFEDSYLIEAWQWTGSLTINVDGLKIGEHEYHILVHHGGWSDSDTVIVHVVSTIEDIPIGAPTDDVGPWILFDNRFLHDLLLEPLFIGVFSLVVFSIVFAFVWVQRKKH